MSTPAGYQGRHVKPREVPIGAPTLAGKAAETIHVAVPNGESPTGATAELAAVEPTQVRRPWRSTVRTVFQALVGLCVMAPVIVGATGLDPEALPWLAGVLAVAAAVARIMALPAVETWLRRFVPWLAAAPRKVTG